jgi:large subunit ribosomal protein L18
MNKQKFIGQQRKRRRFRVRNRLRGTSEQPRMSVSRSHQNIACQLVDDFNRKTLVAASTRDADLDKSLKYGGNCDAASVVGKVIAERALAAGIKRVRFDRGSCQYHGRVAALASAAREAGLQF